MSASNGPRIITNSMEFHLDAADIKSYIKTGTTATNRSKKDNTSTLTSGVIYNTLNGGNFVFDGVAAYINCNTTKTASCTFSCWAKTTSLATSPMLFNAGPNGVGPDLFFNAGQICWNTWDSNNNPFATTPTSVTDGKFHHYVVVNDATSNTKLYYDGNLLGTAVYKNTSANTNLTIGGNSGSYTWNGNIANFKLYNRVLTLQEIQQNFKAVKSRFNT